MRRRSLHPETFSTVALAALLAACPILSTACAGPGGPGRDLKVEDVDDSALQNADAHPGDWLSYGRTYGETRFSPLKKIDDSNVDRLGLAWSYDTGMGRGAEATPIVVDGVIYTTSAWSVVYALDARTGKLLWKWDPEVQRGWGRLACCDVVNRGVAVYEGTVYVGILDGRLAALDAKTGVEKWMVATTDQKQPYTITGAPRVVKGNVIIGNGGSEYGVRGYVSAYDAENGMLVWRFYTVPGNPADGFEDDAQRKAADTWTGEWWKYGGGGSPWDPISYDPELGLVYVGTGNGTPWDPKLRSPDGGDDLYTSSIVALDAETGKLAWYYQVTPRDGWDFDADQQLVLADLKIDGTPRKVVMQASKNGFFYVLDRTNGELISAEPFVPVTWASKVDRTTGRPVVNGAARYDEDGPVISTPGPLGGHNWHPMSYNPETGLVYVPAQVNSSAYGHDDDFTFKPGVWNTGLGSTEGATGRRMKTSGYLLAWDPVAGKERWRVPYDDMWNGGTLTTAGNLVFQGTSDQRFVAYAADTGKKLWETTAPSEIIAGPVTYRVDGVQYVAVMAGWGGVYGLSAGKGRPRSPTGRLLVFALGGTATMPTAGAATAATTDTAPAPEPRTSSSAASAAPPATSPTPSATAGREPPTPIPSDASAATVSEGSRLFSERCAVCHGKEAVSGGTIPDLRYSAPSTLDSLPIIVLKGTRSTRGMPNFSQFLDADDAAAIRAYILSRRAELTGG